MAAQFITTPAAAELIGVEIAHVRQMIDSGELFGKKIGRDWHVSLASVNRVCENPAATGRPRGAKNKTEENVTS